MLIDEFPVDSDRGTEDDSKTGALTGFSRPGANDPEPQAYDGAGGSAAEILLRDSGEAHLMEGPRAKSKIEAAAITEELDVEGDRADAPEGESETHSVSGIRSLGGGVTRRYHGGDDERDDESLHGGTDEVSGWSQRGSAGRRSIGTPSRRVYGGRGLVSVAQRVSASLAMVFLAACSPPDDLGGRRLTLPDSARQWLAPDSVRGAEISPGVVYRYLWSSRGPWAVHIVQVDAARCDLGFEVLQAEPREAGDGGHERVTDMVGRSSEHVLAAVNADFFTPEGTTVGVEVVDGRVTAAAQRPTFAWRPGGDPWLGIASVSGANLDVGWSVSLDAGDGATTAVGGFPDLIDGGLRVGDLEVGQRPTFAAVRHPRTGVGFDSMRRWLWIVVVDGRQAPHSAGMSLPEFAAFFEALGVDEAINLDGGGSTVMVVGGAPVSRPSDPTGERAVANALALVQSRDGCVATVPR